MQMPQERYDYESIIKILNISTKDLLNWRINLLEYIYVYKSQQV